MITSINPRLFPGFKDFKQIGRGGFGIVYTAINEKTGQSIAIKTVDKINLMSESNRVIIHNEISIYNRMKHPFITQYFTTLEDQAGAYTAIEYISSGNLLDYIISHGRLKDTECAKIFCELISAVKYLHQEQHIIHRDIKAENILLDRQFNIRLIDFGLSDFMKDDSSTFNTKCGTYLYSAPEMLKGQNYTDLVDIWSCGVVLYLMMTGTLPFQAHTQKELYQKIVYQEPNYPTFLSPIAKDLLTKMLQKDPEKRINIEGISEHEYTNKSRYCAFLSSDYISQSVRAVYPKNISEVKFKIIELLRKKGVDVSTLTNDLLTNKFTEATTLYKIYAKQEAMNEMQSPEVIRTMYGIKQKRYKSFDIRPISVMHKEKPIKPILSAGSYASTAFKSKNICPVFPLLKQNVEPKQVISLPKLEHHRRRKSHLL